MTDKMEPVAWTNSYLLAELHTSGVSHVYDHATPRRTTPLYTADQVKELTDELEALRRDNASYVAAAADEATRATTAEVALAEARKVIEPFALLRDDLADDEMITLHVENLDDARAWLQANKGDA